MTDMTAEQALNLCMARLRLIRNTLYNGHGFQQRSDADYVMGLLEGAILPALSAPRVPDEAIRRNAPVELDISEQLAWAEGWNACRETMLATAQSPAEPEQDELAKPERNSYDKVIADQDAELAKLRNKYEQLPEIIDDGSESMTHDDAVGELLGLREREKVLEAFRSAVVGWRESDWQRSFCRATAESLARHGEYHQLKEEDRLRREGS